MPGAVLYPEEIDATDTARVLTFVNAVASADVLAETIGLSEGMRVGRRLAVAILTERDASGGLQSLEALMSVTGVTLARFTEIVSALSNARPIRAGGRLRLTPAIATPWLGQSVGITGQVMDETGRGIPGTTVTCFASAGVLTARAGLERQNGSSISLSTEPGGLISFTYTPSIVPPLTQAPRAALEAELARLDTGAETPNAAVGALKSLATRYRAEGGVMLRTAIDRLFEAFPVETQSLISPWSLMPVTLIAVVGGPEGQAELVSVTTLYVRNWLGGWLQVLHGAIEGDTRLDEALKHLDSAAAKGADLSQEIVRASQAFAGLELGVLGQKLRDENAGSQVNRFLERVGPKLKDNAVVNMVRAAGASGAAIQGGGFAVFEAIRAVQDVEDTISRPRFDAKNFTSQLDRFGTRLGHLEEVAVDRATLDGLRLDLTQATDARFVRMDGDLGGLRGRLGDLETSMIDRASFDALKADVTGTQSQVGQLDKRIDGVEADSFTRADLDALETKLTQSLSAEFNSSLRKVQRDFADEITNLRSGFDGTAIGIREEFTGQVSRLNTDLTKRIDARADATEVKGLVADLRRLKLENQTLSGRVDGVDEQINTLRKRPIR